MIWVSGNYLILPLTKRDSSSRIPSYFHPCARLLIPCRPVSPPFSLPQVRNLSRRLAQIQAQLQAAVLDDFKILMGQADVKLSPENLDRLANACLVVDALGAKVRVFGEMHVIKSILSHDSWNRP